MKNGDDKKDKNEEAKEVEQEIKEDKKVEELLEKVKENEEKYKRALADYQNLQKRTQEEKREWLISANRELVLRILPVLDTLERANKHITDEGLKVSIQLFLATLKNEGVVKIETIGKQFDPRFMEAIATGEGEEGKVLEESQAGYMIGDAVLRPALVKVGEKKE